MLSYFTELSDDKATQDKASHLHQLFHFLDKNPTLSMEPTQEGHFKSPFLYELIGTIHLNDISGFIEVNGWDMKLLALGKNGDGVITIAATAVMYKLY